MSTIRTNHHNRSEAARKAAQTRKENKAEERRADREQQERRAYLYSTLLTNSDRQNIEIALDNIVDEFESSFEAFMKERDVCARVVMTSVVEAIDQRKHALKLTQAALETYHVRRNGYASGYVCLDEILADMMLESDEDGCIWSDDFEGMEDEQNGVPDGEKTDMNPEVACSEHNNN